MAAFVDGRSLSGALLGCPARIGANDDYIRQTGTEQRMA
jgi:hypothetical protein